MKFSARSLPVPAAAVVRSSRPAAAASFLVAHGLRPALILLLFGLWTLDFGLGNATAASMRFGPYTNYDGTLITNTTILVRAVGNPAIDANGNVTAAIGLPTRIPLGPDGKWTNTLQNQNYQVTNALGTPAFFNQGYFFRAPLDSGPTVYSTTAPGIFITGLDYFVTLAGGTNGASITFNSITNGLGYAPLAPADTNGFVRLLQITNVLAGTVPTNFWSPSASLWISNLIAFGSLNTNRYASGTLLTSSTNSAGLVTFTAVNQTNGYTPIVFSNAAVFVNTNLLSVTSNGLASAIGSAGISALTATNIATNQVFLGTNGIGIASGLAAFRPTNTFDVSGAGTAAATLATNAVSLASGLSAFRSTNSFDPFGAATAATNGYPWGSLYDAAGLAAGAQTFSVGVSNNVLAKANTNQATLFNPTNRYDSTLTNSFNDFKGKTIADFYVGTTNVGRLEAGHAGDAVVATGRDDTLGFIFWGLDDTGSVSTTNPKQPLVAITGYGDLIVKQRLYIGGNAVIFDTDNDAPNVTLETSQSGAELIFEQPPSMSGAHITSGSIPISALSASVLTNNFKGTITAQGFALDQWLWQTNAANHTIYQTNTTTGAMMSLSSNGDFSVNSAAGVVNLSVANTGITFMRTFGLSGYASQSGKSNIVFINSFGLGVTNDLATFVQSIIAGTAGGVPPLTNAYATNLSTGLVVGQRLYFPTNDLLGASNALATANTTASNFNATANSASSNLLAANKLDKTNGTAYGLTSTNTAFLGNVSFGRDGTDTNIIATTNVVGFYLAGTGLATNGAFIWNSTLGCYTNWVTSAILTNNSTAWLMQTNGTSLYSLAGASPFGVYTAVGGTGTPLGVPGFVFDHNRMVDVGYFSVTNFTVISNSIVTNSVFLSSTGAIASVSGIGTATTLTNPVLVFDKATWGQYNSVGTATVTDAILSGQSNAILFHAFGVIGGGLGNLMSGGASFGSDILGGVSNSITATTGGFIGGGYFNAIGNAVHYSVVSGGRSNNIASGGQSSIIGGEYNLITSSDSAGWSAILGGESNRVYKHYSVAMGHNAVATNDNTLVWSDGTTGVVPTTNSQVILTGTNGLYVNGPIWHGFNSTNGGAYFISNTVSTAFSIYAVTNSMPNFSYWMGESNGILVTIYYSNNVAFMKNNWP